MEIKDEYLIFLENLRKSGVTNMFGAGPYLQGEFGLNKIESREILSYWMTNYGELCEKFGWRN